MGFKEERPLDLYLIPHLIIYYDLFIVQILNIVFINSLSIHFFLKFN